ncbi:MAG: T9SS type A sorting domain-containing protein [Candidatus Aegiribacteria sp.]|nr:T9SS type A sorting domain-containing protein [Candidatus Aegiribacteria sp.]
MLRVLIISLLLIAVTAGAEVVYRAEEPVETAAYLGMDTEGILVEFNLPALTVVDEIVGEFGSGNILRIPGEGMGMPVGSPDLPLVRRMVLIPNTGAVSVEIVSSESSPLGIYNIPPFQEYPTRSGGPAPYRIDENLYSNSEFYPSQSVYVERISILRDIRVAWVVFSPVQYNPVTGETTINTNISVRLTTEGVGENELYKTFQGYTRSYLPIYQKVLGFEQGGTDVIDGSYLVIGSTESIAYAQDLIDWKLQTGLDVQYGVVPGIGGTASEIDDWIEDAYNTWPNPPEWILIVGDENVVPPPYYGGEEADNQYGVIGSGHDPSIHIGRLCGDTGTLAYQSWKIESYENDPYEPASTWFQHAISIGSDDFQDPLMSYRYAQVFMAHDMTTTLYCPNSSHGGIYPTIANISAEVNSGLSLLSYIGHGSQTTWVTTGFSNSNVAALTNGRRLPWISSIACQNSSFDNSTMCFSEAWMTSGSVADPKGAVGFMGATMDSPVGPTDSLAMYQFRGYFEEEMYHMGAAFDYGKIMAYLYTGHAGNSNMHMIMGCPEFDIFTDTSPIVHLAGDHATTIAEGNWNVTVTAGGSPVEGALVGVVQDTALLQSGYTNASGLVTLAIPSIPGTGDVTVTSTHHNLYPYVGSASVSGTGTAGDEIGALSLNLSAPAPNPFAGSTAIAFTLPAAGNMSLDIYDVSGRLVTSIASGEMLAGSHSVLWAGTDSEGAPAPGGIYLLRLTAGGNTMTRSCVIIR